MQFLLPHYDPWVVAASMGIATFASYVALDLAKRVRTGDRRLARNWWIGGSIAMGTGIWSMHFVGMLAFSIPVALGYTPALTALSWLAAVVVSAIALAAASQSELGARRLFVGSATMGAGIFAMHYIGMAALDMAPGIVWNRALVAASLAIAVAASGAALLIFFWLRQVSDGRGHVYQLIAAAVMGLAISGMHYTGMAAASFPIDSICLSAGELGGRSLDTLVAFSAFTLLTITLLTSIFDTAMQTKTARLAASLQTANIGLNQERERFRALTALSSDWFWEQDKELRFTTISASIAPGPASRPQVWRSKRRWELGTVAIGDENWEHHRAQLERRETFHDLQTQRLDDEGRLCTVSVSGAPVYDEAGEFVGYRGVGRDITEQKEQERREALRHTVTRLLAESTSAQDVVSEAIRAVCETCAWPGGILRRVDRSKDTARAEEFWATAGDAPTFDLLLRCDAPVDRDRTATQGGLSGHFNCEIRAGEQRFGELDFRFRGQAGVDAATLGVIRDLGQQIGQFIARRDAEANVRTERELLAQRVSERTLELSEAIRELEIAKVGAEDASRAKSDFLAAMSHEIRTPMNGVIGMIEVLAQSKLTEEQTDAMQTIRASAFSLLGLIDDILDFSKIEAGHLELERTPVALADLVEGVCDMLAPQAAAKGVDLRLYVAPDVPEYVLSDATRLRQMLNNLVGNAVKFSGGRPNVAGRVAVRVQLAAERPLRLVLGVVDNGIGIAAATLEHLFSPFTQAEASTTRRFGGTGLGLAICKRLVALMDGAIDVSSELGAGSTFTVTLPIEPVEGRAWRRYPDLSGLDCIVVSSPKLDDADMRAYLDHAGARVHMAAGVRAAARFASSLAEQLVVVIQHAGADIAAQRAQAPFGTNANVRHVLLGGRARAHTESSPHGVVALTDAGPRRSSFLRAVALAAGRESAAPERLQTPAPQASDRRIAPTIAEARAEGRLILVAEDDAVNQKVILKQLALLGHAAEMASNGAEALRLWLEGRHHLLLSDLHMPELDGYGLARSIRDAEGREPGPPRMPILALTANALHEEAGRVRAAGMDEYLTKPIQLAALGRALERWLPSPMLSPTAATKPGEFNTAAPDLPVDVSVLKRLVGDDADTVREFLAEFLQIARAQAAELIASCEAEDNRCVGMVAHKLKASSRSIGALTLGDLCAELENTSRAGGKAEIAHGRVGFERAMRAVDAYIVDILADQAA